MWNNLQTDRQTDRQTNGRRTKQNQNHSHKHSVRVSELKTKNVIKCSAKLKWQQYGTRTRQDYEVHKQDRFFLLYQR